MMYFFFEFNNQFTMTIIIKHYFYQYLASKISLNQNIFFNKLIDKMKNIMSSRTPTKTAQNTARQTTNTRTPTRATNSAWKQQTSQLPKSSNNALAQKQKQKFFLFPQLQEIYNKLNFNNSFKPFPQQQLLSSKYHMDSLISKMMKNQNQSRCLIHDKEILNIYCEKCKELLCIRCAHTDNTHKDKSHNIVPVEDIKEILKLEIERIREKIQNVIYKLADWKKKLEDKIHELGEFELNISNKTKELFLAISNEIKNSQKEHENALKKNKTRANNIMQSYWGEIEIAKNTYERYLSESSHLEIADQLGLLKILNNQMGIAERLMKQTYQTISVIPFWKEIEVELVKLSQKHQIEKKALEEKFILVTQF